MKEFKNYLKLIYVIPISIFLLSCQTDDDLSFYVSPNNSRTLEEVIFDFNNLTIVPGINDLTVESTFNNVFWNFRIIVPESASDTNKRPLIMRLHGAATIVDEDLHKSTACLIEPGFEELDAIIISPNSDGFIWYDLPNQNKILTLTNLVKNRLPVDTNKIVITGYSDGGNGAWFFAQNHPNIYSASIPMATSYNPDRNGSPLKIDIPMYVIHGSLDQLFALSTTQGYVNTTTEAGTELEFVIAEGLDHFNSCAYIPYLKDAATWLETSVWN